MTDSQLVKIVNRIYHEEEAVAYDASHPEIFEREQETWKRLAVFLPRHTDGMRMLDIASGTGFVYSMLRKHLSERDTFIFSDISQKMLEKAREKFAAGTILPLEFVEVEVEHLPFPRDTFDVVTMNSALHHMPDTQAFLRQVARVLKPGGICIIAHEPNRTFFTNPLLRIVLWSLQKYCGLRARLTKILKQGKKTTTTPDFYKTLYARVNEQLRREGMIEADFTDADIQAYVDVHSPTARGRVDATKGFTASDLHLLHFPTWEMLFFETHAHLGKIDPRPSRILRFLDAALATVFPRDGSSLSVVFKKPH